MSLAASAELRYGYNLGGGEFPWLIEGLADEYDPWHVSWAGGEDFDALDDPLEDANLRLLEMVAGFAEEWKPGDTSYLDRRNAAQTRVGVEMVSYGHHDHRGYALLIDDRIGPATAATCSSPRALDLPALDRQRRAESWGTKLDAALRVLDLKPATSRGWLLLVSYT